MNAAFAELIVHENSSIGAGTRIKLQKAELASFSAMKETLSDCTRFNSAAYKLGYIDTESEVIELMDESDWITCVEEAQATSPNHPLISVIIVGKEEKWNRESLTSLTITRSWFMTPIPKANVDTSKIDMKTDKTPSKSEVIASTSSPQKPSVVDFASDIKAVAPPQPAPHKSTIENPSAVHKTPSEPVNPEVNTLQAPPEPVITKTSSTQHPKDQSYRFSYTEAELETVRKVSLPVFIQLERILAQKYEEGLVQGEQAFKVFLEQQNKKKAIEHQKQVSALQQTIDSLKKELLAAQTQAAQGSGLFASAALAPTSLHPLDPSAQTPTSRKQSTTSTPQEGQGQQDRYLHLQVSCDGCGAFPLPGIRYKALEKADFDLCESCFLAEKDTKKAYLALRETEPNKHHALVQLARASEQPNYKEDNNHFQRLHKWGDTEYKFKDLAFE